MITRLFWCVILSFLFSAPYLWACEKQNLCTQEDQEKRARIEKIVQTVFVDKLFEVKPWPDWKIEQHKRLEDTYPDAVPEKFDINEEWDKRFFYLSKCELSWCDFTKKAREDAQWRKLVVQQGITYLMENQEHIAREIAEGVQAVKEKIDSRFDADLNRENVSSRVKLMVEEWWCETVLFDRYKEVMTKNVDHAALVVLKMSYQRDTMEKQVLEDLEKKYGK